MPRASSRTFVAVLYATFLIATQASAAPVADDDSGESIVAKMWDRYRRVGTEHEALEILVVAAPEASSFTTEDVGKLVEDGGRGVTHKRAARDTAYGDEGKDKIYVRFSLPRRDAGTGFLVHRDPKGQDSQWLFLPALRKVRRVPISSTQTFVGTNFVYEDIRQLAGERTDRFEYERLPDEDVDGKRCHVVVAQPKAGTTSAYSQRKTWIDREVLYPLQVEYYDKTGKLWKRLRSSAITPVKADSYRAALTEMRDLQLKEATLLWITEREVGQPIPSEVFTQDYLERPTDF